MLLYMHPAFQTPRFCYWLMVTTAGLSIGSSAVGQQPPAPPPPTVALPDGIASPALACVPGCRAGFACLDGFCISTLDTVHLETRQGQPTVELQERDPVAGWIRVCELPCSIDVKPSRPYRLAGAGVRKSYVELAAMPNHSTVGVEPGSAWTLPVGMVVGIAGSIIGGVGLIFATVDIGPLGPHGGTSRARDRDRTGAFVIAGLGGLSSIVGFSMVFGDKTTYAVVPRAVDAQPEYELDQPRITASLPPDPPAPPPPAAPPPLARRTRIDPPRHPPTTPSPSACNPGCLDGLICSTELTCVPPRIDAKMRARAKRIRLTGRRHDGFFLSFGAGPGGVWQIDGGRAETGLGFDWAIGGTPWEGVVVGFAEHALNMEGDPFILAGAMIDYYPDVTGGLHASATVGPGVLLVDHDESLVGLGLSTAVGYQTWTGYQWSIGPLVRVAYVAGPNVLATTFNLEFVYH